MDRDKLVVNPSPRREISEKHEDSFVVDNMSPEAVFTPKTTDELRDLVNQANADNLSVVPFGGGTRKNFGMPPTRYDIALDLRELSGVTHYNPDDLTISVQAGTTLDSLQSVLLEHGQFLPISSPLSNLSTLGGILASDVSGPIKWRYGHVRDLVIGMKFLNSDGSMIKTGGNVVKNVTGYDTAKLHIGALGTLGIINEVSMRLMPKPRVNHTMIIEIESISAAINSAKAIFQSSLMPLALSVFTGKVAKRLGISPEGQNTFVAINVIGGPRSVERQGKELYQLCAIGNPINAEILSFLEAGSFWQKLTDFGWEDSYSSVATVTVSTDFLSLKKIIYDLVHFRCEDGINMELILNPGCGTMDIHWIDEESQVDLERFTKYLREILIYLRSRSGRVIVERCPTSIKQKIDVWGEIPGGISIMHAIKKAYDPNRIFNPGRFVAGI